jgi:hypothetical protein
MQLKVTSGKDFGAGLLFLAIGGTSLAVAQNYALGSLSRMGPGYFPTVLSGVLLIVGFALFIRSFQVVEPGPRGFRPWAVLAVLGGAALFAVGVEALGLAITSALVIVVTYLGGWEVRWHQLALLVALMTALVIVLFIILLKMQLRIGPALWS